MTPADDYFEPPLKGSKSNIYSKWLPRNLLIDFTVPQSKETMTRKGYNIKKAYKENFILCSLALLVNSLYAVDKNFMIIHPGAAGAISACFSCHGNQTFLASWH